MQYRTVRNGRRLGTTALIACAALVAAACGNPLRDTVEERSGVAPAEATLHPSPRTATTRVAHAIVTGHWDEAAKWTVGAAHVYATYFRIAETLVPPDEQAAGGDHDAQVDIRGARRPRPDGSVPVDGTASYVNAQGVRRTFTDWLVERPRHRRGPWLVSSFRRDGRDVGDLVVGALETTPVTDSGVGARLLAAFASPADPLALTVLVEVANRSAPPVVGESADLLVRGEPAYPVEFVEGRASEGGSPVDPIPAGVRSTVLLQWVLPAPPGSSVLSIGMSGPDHQRTLALHLPAFGDPPPCAPSTAAGVARRCGAH